MTRRSIQSLDMQAAEEIAALASRHRELLNGLRVRLLLAPAQKEAVTISQEEAAALAAWGALSTIRMKRGLRVRPNNKTS